MKKLLAHYWPELLITIAVWAFMGWKFGLSAFILTVILSILEITLSADNAIVNSKVLVKLSVFWQRMFLTVGILIAVFGVRFALPILMVSVTTSLDIGTVFSLALNHPEEYGRKLHEVAPVIDGFGGMFLLMVAMFFFIDKKRDKIGIWLRLPEEFLFKLSKWHVSRFIVPLIIFTTLLFFIPESLRSNVAIAMLLGALTYVLLHMVTSSMEKFGDVKSDTGQVGLVAFMLFMYLQVLDASFSLDGVVGAFAITNNIIIIMAGLGIGALWVRTFTIYMVRHDTLLKYRFLDSGAHWAIVSLAAVMLLKVGGIELPEIVIGSIGLVFISAAVLSSVKRK